MSKFGNVWPALSQIAIVLLLLKRNLAQSEEVHTAKHKYTLLIGHPDKDMMYSAAVMDAALLLIAVNESCPQPQAKEHLEILEILGLHDFAIIQNKVDLVSQEKAQKNYNSIKIFIRHPCHSVPVITISARWTL